MLIVYRTNPGFAGNIVNVERSGLPKEKDRFLATKEGKDLSYIEINEKLADGEVVADLLSHNFRYTVDVNAKTLLRDGKDVDLGYDSDDAKAKIAGFDDPVVKKFFEATEAELSAWATGKPIEILS